MPSRSATQRLFATVILLTLASTALAAADATCYYPNGTESYDNTGVMPYTPCNTRAKHSMCCRSNSTDTCRSDGLCDSSWDGNIWRDFCTDPTWRAPECVKLCLGTDGTDGDGNNGGTVKVTKCPNGSYCCGIGSVADSCCTTGAGVWIAQDGQTTGVKPGSSSTASSTTTTTGTSSSVSTTAPAAVPISSQTSSAPSAAVTKTTTKSTTDTGVIAGGVVAGVVAAALMIGAAVWALRRRRNRRMEEKPMWVPPTTVKTPAVYVGEMEGCNARRELPADTAAHEMVTGGPTRKQNGRAELA